MPRQPEAISAFISLCQQGKPAEAAQIRLPQRPTKNDLEQMLKAALHCKSPNQEELLSVDDLFSAIEHLQRFFSWQLKELFGTYSELNDQTAALASIYGASKEIVQELAFELHDRHPYFRNDKSQRVLNNFINKLLMQHKDETTRRYLLLGTDEQYYLSDTRIENNQALLTQAVKDQSALALILELASRTQDEPSGISKARNRLSVFELIVNSADNHYFEIDQESMDWLLKVGIGFSNDAISQSAETVFQDLNSRSASKLLLTGMYHAVCKNDQERLQQLYSIRGACITEDDLAKLINRSVIKNSEQCSALLITKFKCIDWSDAADLKNTLLSRMLSNAVKFEKFAAVKSLLTACSTALSEKQVKSILKPLVNKMLREPLNKHEWGCLKEFSTNDHTGTLTKGYLSEQMRDLRLNGQLKNFRKLRELGVKPTTPVKLSQSRHSFHATAHAAERHIDLLANQASLGS